MLSGEVSFGQLRVEQLRFEKLRPEQVRHEHLKHLRNAKLELHYLRHNLEELLSCEVLS